MTNMGEHWETKRKWQTSACLVFDVFEEIGELLAVLLPHVRRSIEVAQIEATNIIEMLEGEVGSTQAPSVDQALHRTLSRMPLSALLGLIMRRDAFGASLEQEVEVLRCRLGWTWSSDRGRIEREGDSLADPCCFKASFDPVTKVRELRSGLKSQTVKHGQNEEQK